MQINVFYSPLQRLEQEETWEDQWMSVIQTFQSHHKTKLKTPESLNYSFVCEWEL